MVAQPRRIAARALKDYVGRSLGPVVGLRMGGGVREETADSCIYFVTTGYLMQYMIHKQHTNVTHLIIDEVHERSIAADVLCYLLRKMLVHNPAMRLILMSATMHTNIYRDYFTGFGSHDFGDLNPLAIGTRRFETTIIYLEDMALNSGKAFKMIAEVAKRAMKLIKPMQDCFAEVDVMILAELLKAQYRLVPLLIDHMCPLGSGVLVFVSGLMDILELSKLFEYSKKCKLFFLHPEIPLEAQMEIFTPASPKHVKVVIATNAGKAQLQSLILITSSASACKVRVALIHKQTIHKWLNAGSPRPLQPSEQEGRKECVMATSCDFIRDRCSNPLRCSIAPKYSLHRSKIPS